MSFIDSPWRLGGSCWVSNYVLPIWFAVVQRRRAAKRRTTADSAGERFESASLLGQVYRCTEQIRSAETCVETEEERQRWWSKLSRPSWVTASNWKTYVLRLSLFWQMFQTNWLQLQTVGLLKTQCAVVNSSEILFPSHPLYTKLASPLIRWTAECGVLLVSEVGF